VDFPSHLRTLITVILEHSRVLGLAGSLVMVIFLAAVLYSLIGQRRVIKRITVLMDPLKSSMPDRAYPLVLAAIRIIVSAIIPLLLLAAFSLVSAMTRYQAPWFTILGHLLVIWTAGSLILRLLREFLAGQLFEATRDHGKAVYRLARLALVYAMVGIALVWCAEGLQLRQDVLEFFKFVISVSIVIVLFLLHLKKTALLSFLPNLPYPGYQTFLRLLNRFYFPLILISLTAALLWCIGYRELGRVILVKIAFSGLVYLAIMMGYHTVSSYLNEWQRQLSPRDEAAHSLVRSMRSLVYYAMGIATVFVVLNLVGLLSVIQRFLSFPVFSVGGTLVTLWTLVTAGLVLTAFVIGSRLIEAYLDYKIYPRLGIDQGLGYMLNTLIKYAALGVGLLISLNVVGIDLRFLLVFAGALGIGIGLGLQDLAGNVISGFTIIFGGKIRKGDWIETGGTIGEVTDIFLRATKIRTRDNVEYLVPNSTIISNTIINYSLSSPMIRIELPVGVSYDANPREVERIMVDVANKDPLVAGYRGPEVRFVAYGDNSINFELLFWIDVRTTARRLVRSSLYFAIFDALKAEGIEIPFPQRDIHIRSAGTVNPESKTSPLNVERGALLSDP
jgi:small-conductance mechanosensitive channel